MQYLMIKNPGCAPIEGYTMFGATTKRDSTDPRIIGTFGSGNKHGIALAIRQLVPPIIFTGDTRIEFYSKPLRVQGVAGESFSQQLCVKLTNGEESTTKELNHTLEYGAKDWKDIDFALREFISNAIDACYEQGLSHEDVKIALVEENEIKSESGYTKVYIPANAAVVNFYLHINKWFLHFSEPELLTQKIFPKRNRNQSTAGNAVIYRRGVLVREFSVKTPAASLFDYNLDDLLLNESRDSSDWDVKWYAAQALKDASENVVCNFVMHFMQGDLHWEHTFDGSSLVNHYDSTTTIEKRYKLWNQAIEKVCGDKYCTTIPHLQNVVINKGYKAFVVNESYYKFFAHLGLRSDTIVLSDDDINHRQSMPPTSAVKDCLNALWNHIKALELDYGRPKPDIKCFRMMTSGGATTMGFWKDDTVSINMDIAENVSDSLRDTMLEELAHHVTKATDGSRDFANWLIMFSVENYKKASRKRTKV